MVTTIARRYGSAASAEWQVLLNQFNLGEGFALVILSVPDRDGAAMCRSALEGFLAERSLHLGTIEPEDPNALRALATTLLGLPEDPGRGGVWVSAVIGETARDRTNWEAAWRQALGSLNQQRNPFRQHFGVPVIFVGAPWVAALLRETAPDLWSVRAMSLHIEPEMVAGWSGLEPLKRELLARIEQEVPVERTPDLDMAMRAAEQLRGKPGQEHALADILARAGSAFIYRREWEEAKKIWLEVVALFRQTNDAVSMAVAWTEIGYISVKSKYLDDALESYQKALTIREQLVREDPNSITRRRDLSQNYYRIGDVLEDLGEFSDALEALRQGLEIVEQLTREDPDNSFWQSGLLHGLRRKGEVLVAQGSLENAIVAFRDAETIAERLALRNPHGPVRKESQAIIHQRIGDVLAAQGDFSGALSELRKCIEIRESFALRHPECIAWQENLSLSHSKIGDVLMAQGDFTGALAAFHESMAISERQEAQDPNNAHWQRDVLVSLTNLAGVAAAAGQQAESVSQAERAVALARALVTRFPNNPQHGRDLPVVEGMLQLLRDAGP